MMINMKKWTAAFLVMLMIVTIFAGCGQKVEQPSQAPAGTEKKAESTSTPEKKESVNIKFACWDYAINDYDKNIVTEFGKANPDIKVEVFDFPASEYGDKMTIMLAGGEDIDVFYAKSGTDYGAYVLKKQIMQLDDLVARDNFDLTPYGSILDSAARIDGKLYGLPYRSDFWHLYYNKDIFDKAGVPYPTNDWTWQDFRDAAKKLTSGEGNDKIYGTYIQTWASAYFLHGLQKGEGDLVEGDYSMLKDGLELLNGIQLEDKSAADYATNKSMGAHYRGIFESGKIGMLYMGTWFANALVTDKNAGKHNVNWSVVQIPTWKGMEDATIGNMTPVVINAKTKKVDAAWIFAKFAGGEEGAKILAKSLLMPAYKTDAVMDIFAQNPNFPKDGLDGLKTNKVYLEWPPHKLSGLLGKMLDEEIQMVVTQNKSIDQAIKDMEARRKEIIEQNQ